MNNFETCAHTKSLRSLIREVLLTEQVFGAQAFIYHGSNTPPDEMKDILLGNRFEPGGGFGGLYGRGLYAVYEANHDLPTFTGFYGKFVYKLKANLYGCVIFDKDVCLKTYGKIMTPYEQLDMLGMHAVKDRIEFHLSNRRHDIILRILDDMMSEDPDYVKFTSDEAHKMCDVLMKTVKGAIFTGRTDGKVALIYDTSGIVPVGWKSTELDLEAGYALRKEMPFNSFDKSSLKPAIARSVMDDFTPGRFNS